MKTKLVGNFASLVLVAKPVPKITLNVSFLLNYVIKLLINVCCCDLLTKKYFEYPSIDII